MEQNEKPKMTKDEQAMVLLFELRMVALYRDLVKSGPLAKLEALLDASMVGADGKRKADRLSRAAMYSDFLSDLYAKGGALGPYLEESVEAIDNTYVRMMAEGKTPPAAMSAAFKREMDLFTRLGVLTAAEIMDMAGLPKTMSTFEVIPRNMIVSVPKYLKAAAELQEAAKAAEAMPKEAEETVDLSAGEIPEEAEEMPEELETASADETAAEIKTCDMEQFIEAFFAALSRECYYEIVDDRMFEEIGIRKEDVVLPRIATEGSAGADFFAPFDIYLRKGEEIKVPTGVKAHCHRFTRLTIVPKSGLGFKYYTRLANTVGIVDADYYGNPGNDGCIFVKLRNEGEKDLLITKGEAFCQGIFEPYIPDRDLNKEELAKREGGFGSTEAKAE